MWKDQREMRARRSSRKRPERTSAARLRLVPATSWKSLETCLSEPTGGEAGGPAVGAGGEWEVVGVLFVGAGGVEAALLDSGEEHGLLVEAELADLVEERRFY